MALFLSLRLVDQAWQHGLAEPDQEKIFQGMMCVVSC